MLCYFYYNCCSVYKAPPNRQKSSSIVLSPSSSPVRLIAHTRHTDTYTIIYSRIQQWRSLQWTEDNGRFVRATSVFGTCLCGVNIQHVPTTVQYYYYYIIILFLLLYAYVPYSRNLSYWCQGSKMNTGTPPPTLFFYLHMCSVHALNRWRHWISFINSNRRGNDRLLQWWYKIVV